MIDTELKLFVWPHFCPNYNDGLAFAIAYNEQDAKDLVVAHHGYYPPDHLWGNVEIYPLWCPVAFAVSGGS